MFDFLNSKLSPKVRCSSAMMDGYEAENLISPNDLTKSRGFLAYTSIKPPVDVDFELICPVSLGYVFISTTVGTQKSIGLELLARNRKESEFVSIARAFFNNNEDGVFFCNSRLFSISSPPPNYNNRFYLCFLKSHSFRIFISAIEVRVRILKTDKSVPCLGRIEIWGRVSKMCSETTACTIKRLMQPPTKVASSSNAIIEGVNSQKESFDVPEEFKDALTYEIMAIPMTLPSGSTIDKTTLEKFIENEASYGRQPSDPFTGLKFNQTRKPVLNTALKSRIDMFLIKHADVPEVRSASRTVGKSTEITTQMCKVVNRNVNTKRKVDHACNNNNSNKTKRYSGDGSSADDDLNALIKRTVHSENFIRFTVEEHQPKDKIFDCVECKTSDNLYILPCNHLYCRKCVIDVSSELKCKLCCAAFMRIDVKKYHVV